MRFCRMTAAALACSARISVSAGRDYPTVDEQADYFHLDKEENPAMGLRAIRIA